MRARSGTPQRPAVRIPRGGEGLRRRRPGDQVSMTAKISGRVSLRVPLARAFQTVTDSPTRLTVLSRLWRSDTAAEVRPSPRCHGSLDPYRQHLPSHLLVNSRAAFAFRLQRRYRWRSRRARRTEVLEGGLPPPSDDLAACPIPVASRRPRSEPTLNVQEYASGRFLLGLLGSRPRPEEVDSIATTFARQGVYRSFCCRRAVVRSSRSASTVRYAK